MTKLIHPVKIEINLLDKSSIIKNDRLKETTGKPIFRDVFEILGQKSSVGSENKLNMAHGGNQPDGNGYFLVYIDKLIEKLNSEIDSNPLDKIITAKISKEGGINCSYSIIDAIPCTVYNGKFHFVRLMYQKLSR